MRVVSARCRIVAAAVRRSPRQDFPTKQIRLIVPFPPGGPNDIIARVVGQRMSDIFKQPIIIDNQRRPGRRARHRRGREGRA